MENQNKLPADPLSMVLGVISLLIAITLGCLGTPALGILLSIIGIVLANQSLKLFQKNPNQFSELSKRSVNTAKTINVIALIINAFIVLLFVVIIFWFSGFVNLFESWLFESSKEVYQTESKLDSEYEYDYSEDQKVIEMMDSLYQEQDSIKIQ